MLDIEKYFNNFTRFEHVESRLLIQPASSTYKVYTYSIAIPTYKRPELLLQAVQSCLKQDYMGSDWQIVIVDNDPTENESIVAQLLEIGGNIYYYKNTTNLGMFGNWNRCLELSNSEFVTILSDDDLLYPGYLREMNNQIQNNANINMICGYYDRFVNGRIIRDNASGLFNYMNNILFYDKIREINLLDYFLKTFGFSSSCIMFRRKRAIELGGYDVDLFPSADYHFQTKFVYNFTDCFLYRKFLAVYRIGENESMKRDVCEKVIEQHSYVRFGMINKISLPKFILKLLASKQMDRDVDAMSRVWGHDLSTFRCGYPSFKENTPVVIVFTLIVEKILRMSRTIKFSS
jgi:glycosyltransferase involved in cell wall biosynthesis